ALARACRPMIVLGGRQLGRSGCAEITVGHDDRVMVKHGSASVFLFARLMDREFPGWREHPAVDMDSILNLNMRHLPVPHRLKQQPHWRLSQSEPGIFVWTTPSGRRSVTRPDPYQV
ncbi:MAG: hypothetical protein ABJB47_15645, partial [Actinomycetota bacterium]